MKNHPRLKKYYLWGSRHPVLFFLLFGGILCTLYTLFLYLLDAPTWLIITVNICILISALLHPATCNNKLIIITNQDLVEDCDPYPLMEEIDRQLAANKSKQYEQLLLINKYVSWLYAGEYQKVFDTLNAINIDQFAGTPPHQKLSYYNNLNDICTKLGYLEHADAWYQKQLQIYATIKSKALQKMFAYTMDSAKAMALYRKQEYTMAINAFSALPFKNRLQRIETSMFIAKCHLALNQKEEARRALCYITANGNKLALVEEAKTLLEQL